MVASAGDGFITLPVRDASVVGTVSTSVLRSSARTSAQRLKQTTTRLRETQVHHAGVTDVRPVESEDIDPYGTQLFAASDWIDPDAVVGSDRGPAGPTSADPGRPKSSSAAGLAPMITPLADGWQERQRLHQVHPLLVHAVLFGGGYLPAALAAAGDYL